MDARGLAIFQEFATQSAPNASNVARHRYIDDFLRARIGREPDLQVVLLGCGFDSWGRAESSAAAADARRPFRLHRQGLSAVGMTRKYVAARPTGDNTTKQIASKFSVDAASRIVLEPGKRIPRSASIPETLAMESLVLC
jgi:hypothetical protein